MKRFLGAMHKAINQVYHEYQWADICMLFLSVLYPTNHFTDLASQQL